MRAQDEAVALKIKYDLVSQAKEVFTDNDMQDKCRAILVKILDRVEATLDNDEETNNHE
jgi:hypothetical protein